MFPCRYIYTNIPEYGRYKNQIDHILVNVFKNSTTNVRKLREADTDSDHLLIRIWLRVKFKKHCNLKPTVIDRYNIERLEDENILKNYVRSDIYKTWNQVRDFVRQAANTIIEIKKNRKKPFFNRVYENSVQRRMVIRY